MRRRCVYCPTPHFFGKAEPLSDNRVTHGMCAKGAKIANAALEEAFGPAIAAKAEPFFYPSYCGNATFSRREYDNQNLTEI